MDAAERNRAAYGMPPEVEGREGGRQGGRGPAPGSAWVKFRATQVLGGSAAGIFSSVPPEYVQKDNSNQEKEAEEVEATACRMGEMTWQLPGVPPPDFSVINDDVGPSVRAELNVFTRKADGTLREMRLRGPRRKTAPEARKDGSDLRRVAFHRFAAVGPGDAAKGAHAEALLARAQELEEVQWTAVDLMGEDVAEGAERRLPEFTTATQAEKFKEQEKSVSSLREWIYAKKEEQLENYQPAGPSWSLAGQAMAVPRLPGVWYVHERQQEGGRPLPWLFFNASSGKYYRRVHGTPGSWVQAGTPHHPESHPVTISSGVMCQPSAAPEGARKDDLAVALLDLPRTAQALKQPVPFIDKPAALFVLVDGLRSSNGASEFCAKRFHSQILPRLSARSDPLEDHELVAIMRDSLESLDAALLDSAARFSGCGVAVALLLGRRLAVCTLGDCRVVLCRKRRQARLLAPTAAAHCAAERRLRAAYAPLDLATAGRPLHAASAGAELLAAAPSDSERLLLRIARAAHPFAALGLSVANLQGGVPVVPRALAECEEQLQPCLAQDHLRERAENALARVREAAAEVESFMSMDAYVTQILAELYYLVDEEDGIVTPKRAAALLGVEPGCGEAAAQAGIDRRYRALMTQLAAVSPSHAQRGLRILAELAEAAAKSGAWWVPTEKAVGVTRALGFRDLKRQRPLVGLELASEVLQLEDGLHFLALLTDGARGLDEVRLAQLAEVHGSRPKAASLRIAADAGKSAPEEAVGVIAVTLQVGVETEARERASDKGPEPKKRKVENLTPGGKRKVRVASLLMKYSGASEADSLARRKAPSGRTQANAEKALMEVLEELAKVQPKELASKFAAMCEAFSDCKSATNKPHADLGWVLEGQFGKEFDAVAFELEVGGLSDIFTTPRGAHILYRLA
ncbi:unnamed protein product [Effrenium voratum]|nr:unnamed protein product [Effrenium voratum]